MKRSEKQGGSKKAAALLQSPRESCFVLSCLVLSSTHGLEVGCGNKVVVQRDWSVSEEAEVCNGRVDDGWKTRDNLRDGRGPIEGRSNVTI